jgi:hypothetical protein
MAEKGARFAIVSLVGSVLGVAGLVMLWVTSTTSFTPGNAIVGGSAGIGLVGWLAAIVLGLASLRSSSRTLGMVSIVIAGFTAAGFVYLISTASY